MICFNDNEFIEDRDFSNCVIEIHSPNTQECVILFENCTFNNVTFQGSGYLNISDTIVENSNLGSLSLVCQENSFIDQITLDTCQRAEGVLENYYANMHVFSGSLLALTSSIELENTHNPPSIIGMSVDYHMTDTGLKVIEYNEIFTSGQSGYWSSYRDNIKEEIFEFYNVLGFFNDDDKTVFEQHHPFLADALLHNKGISVGLMSTLAPDYMPKVYTVLSNLKIEDRTLEGVKTNILQPIKDAAPENNIVVLKEFFLAQGRGVKILDLNAQDAAEQILAFLAYVTTERANDKLCADIPDDVFQFSVEEFCPSLPLETDKGTVQPTWRQFSSVLTYGDTQVTVLHGLPYAKGAPPR